MLQTCLQLASNYVGHLNLEPQVAENDCTEPSLQTSTNPHTERWPPPQNEPQANSPRNLSPLHLGPCEIGRAMVESVPKWVETPCPQLHTITQFSQRKRPILVAGVAFYRSFPHLFPLGGWKIAFLESKHSARNQRPSDGVPRVLRAVAQTASTVDHRVRMAF